MKFLNLKPINQSQDNSSSQPTSSTVHGDIHTPKYAYEPATAIKLERSKQPTVEKIGEFNFQAKEKRTKVQVERTSVDELASDATAWLNYWY